MAHYNWAPVVRSFLERLQVLDIRLIRADDGGEYFVLPLDPAAAIEEAIDCITSVDESTLRIGMGLHRALLFFVLGNGPEEILCDWSVPKDSYFQAAIELANNAHYQEWDGKPCPTVES